MYRGAGLNLYAYCDNNPVTYFDPSGYAPCQTKQDLYKRYRAEGYSAADANHLANTDLIRQNQGDTAANKYQAANPVGKASDSNGATEPKTYQTYTKTNPTTGEVYSGRTSGKGTPIENVAKRDANHHMNDKGFGPAELDKTSSNKNAIRGREQQLIEANGGAKSKGGTSGNAINGIGPNNKKKDIYIKAAEEEFK